MSNSQFVDEINMLMVRIQRKDRLALKELYGHTNIQLLSLITRVLKDQVEAEDVLQEVFVKIWDQAKRYSGKGSAWGWICTIARHTSIDHLRKLTSHPYESTDESPELLNQLSEVNKTIDKHWVGQCMEKLKPQMRQAILLSFFNGFTHSEISKDLSAPLGTVKAWVRRGLVELKECLAV